MAPPPMITVEEVSPLLQQEHEAKLLPPRMPGPPLRATAAPDAGWVLKKQQHHHHQQQPQQQRQHPRQEGAKEGEKEALLAEEHAELLAGGAGRGIAAALRESAATLIHLFFAKRFRTHRVFGLCYLLQWAAALAYYCVDYDGFKDSFLVWSLPVSGIVQSITAMRTFTFLPKKAVDPGYFSDKITMSYPFIVENSFFATILLFQWLYYNDRFYDVIRKTVVPETVFVFLPYFIRNFWPKTSFRDSLAHPKYKTDRNQRFYYYAVNVTKAFYVWAKHYIGYFLNYVRFLRRDTEVQKYHIYHLLIFSAFATTVSVFLHTLKFKKYIGARLSFFVYSGSYFATFYGFLHITDVFVKNVDLVVLVLCGLALNFRHRYWQYAYQIFMLAVLYSVRFNCFPRCLEPFFAALGHPGGY